LFQINSINTKTALFFTPEPDEKSSYVVAFGLSAGALDYGFSFAAGDSRGVNIALIHDQAPNTTYHYQIRGQNDCIPGAWSNIMAATTSNSPNQVRVHYVNNNRVNIYQKRR
jgi:hypothetical protein